MTLDRPDSGAIRFSKGCSCERDGVLRVAAVDGSFTVIAEEMIGNLGAVVEKESFQMCSVTSTFEIGVLLQSADSALTE